MPITYAIYDTIELVFARWTGDVDHVDFVKVSDAIQSDPLYRPSFKLLVDLSKVEKMDFSADALEYLSERYSRHLIKAVTNQDTAVVATSDTSYELATIYAEFANRIGAEPTTVFRELDAAIAWLDLPSATLDLIGVNDQ